MNAAFKHGMLSYNITDAVSYQYDKYAVVGIANDKKRLHNKYTEQMTKSLPEFVLDFRLSIDR